jgi:hypothetical protein
MDQLFLAVLKATMRCLKGRLFSRYGPARTEMVGLQRFIDSCPSGIIKAPAPSPATADVAISSNALPLQVSALQYYTLMDCWHHPIDIGRELIQRLTALFRTLEFNALSIPLQQEGAC